MKKEKHSPIERFSFINFLLNFFKKSTDIKGVQIKPNRESSSTTSSTIIKTTKFARFIYFLILIQKFLKNLKWRTQFLRDLNFVNDRQISVINDTSHFQKINNNRYFFIRNKFLRRTIRGLRNKFKHPYNFLSKIL